MSQDYDKILKENIAALFLPLSEKYLGIRILSSRELPEKLQTTIEREPDFLKIVEDSGGKEFILHIEFQASNEPDMVYRMAEYRAILQRKYKLPVRQFVLYLGQKKLAMKSHLEPEEIISSFALSDARDFAPDQMLTSTVPEEIILSILGEYPKKDAVAVVQKILNRLQELCGDSIRLQKYVKQLTILSRLRKLEGVTRNGIKKMAITYDVSTDSLYQEGKREGKQEGIEQVFQVKQLLDVGKTEREISQITKLSLATVQRIVGIL